MPVKIFFSYAHKDEALLKKLQVQLKSLQQLGLIYPWHDRDIYAGTEWEQEIRKQLNEAQIFLLLLSSDFLASAYCHGEMERAKERHERGEATLIPINLRPSFWQDFLGNFQALPADGKPIKGRTRYNEEKAFYDTAKGIRKVVESLLQELPHLDAKVVGKVKKEQPDTQAFRELKTSYSWISDKHLAVLQGLYQTWKQLAGANRGDLVGILSGILLPPESPSIISDQVGVILAFARAKVRLQEEETT